MTTLTEEAVRSAMDGSNGVTSGPWRVNQPTEKRVTNIVTVDDGKIAYLTWDRSAGGNAHRDAFHIARCDPEFIRALCEDWLRNQWQPIETAPKDEWIDTLSLPWSRLPTCLMLDSRTHRWVEPDAPPPAPGVLEEWQPTHWRALSPLPEEKK